MRLLFSFLIALSYIEVSHAEKVQYMSLAQYMGINGSALREISCEEYLKPLNATSQNFSRLETREQLVQLRSLLVLLTHWDRSQFNLKPFLPKDLDYETALKKAHFLAREMAESGSLTELTPHLIFEFLEILVINERLIISPLLAPQKIDRIVEIFFIISDVLLNPFADIVAKSNQRETSLRKMDIPEINEDEATAIKLVALIRGQRTIYAASIQEDISKSLQESARFINAVAAIPEKERNSFSKLMVAGLITFLEVQRTLTIEGKLNLSEVRKKHLEQYNFHLAKLLNGKVLSGLNMALDAKSAAELYPVVQTALADTSNLSFALRAVYEQLVLAVMPTAPAGKAN